MQSQTLNVSDSLAVTRDESGLLITRVGSKTGGLFLPLENALKYADT